MRGVVVIVNRWCLRFLAYSRPDVNEYRVKSESSVGLGCVRVLHRCTISYGLIYG